MCRSIKTLRAPVTPEVTEDDIHAAALQYVRKVSGFRAPAAHNQEAFDRAVAAVTEATRELLEHLVVRGAHQHVNGHQHDHDHSHEHQHQH
ncbi:hypothetical protein F4556_006873 [Kitasatospora gansuensis]|uniref:DUF2277 domain-containing protein n=1 Tax=Kitasatospora gansuensis TaxID=258050 RepID=A0A7W7SK25_9ACTN|nr:DUF2277 domain-containing protein [Kitasatospora gansuensis]MBB4951338.1 hypothetical protein [Kitasatospora gansuensis]